MNRFSPVRSLIRRSEAVVGVLLLTGALASADILGSYVVNLDGSVTYSYEVDNTTGLFDVALWSLDFDFGSPDWDQLDVFSGGGVSVPDPNWFADAGTPVSGLSAQDFLALDPTGDVLIGDLRGGFSFTSWFPPGTVAYHEFSALGDSAAGSTVGPVSPVPEGAGWAAGLALAGVLALGARRRTVARRAE